MKCLLIGLLAWIIILPTIAENSFREKSLEQEIKSLKPDKLQRRNIPWKTCLIKAYKQAQEENKPVFIWAFLGDPIEGRC